MNRNTSSASGRSTPCSRASTIARALFSFGSRCARALLPLAAALPVVALAGEGSARAEEWSDTAPESGTTLVLPTKEDTISGFTKLRNWTHSDCNASKNWKSWEGGKHHVENGVAPLSMIVIHETGNDVNAFTRTDGGVHFVVHRDGVVCQLAPLSKRYTHAPGGSRSIGIEIANGAKGANHTGSSAGVGSECKKNVKVGWRGMFEKYHCLPTEDQLKSLHTLVAALQSKLGIAKTVGNAAPGSGIFLANAQGVQYGTLAATVAATKGVVSHGVLESPPKDRHGDGGLETLYLWLRSLGADHDIAYCKLLAITQRDPLNWADLPTSVRDKVASGVFVSLTFLQAKDASDEWCTDGTPPDPPAQYTPAPNMSVEDTNVSDAKEETPEPAPSEPSNPPGNDTE